MALGIHKPGEGYWVRVMTACFIAVAAIALAVWSWKQTELVTEWLPKSAYALLTPSTSVKGEAPLGARVSLVGIAPSDGSPAPVIGTAVIKGFDAGRTVTIDQLALTDAKLDTGSIKALRTDAGFEAEVSQSVAQAPVRQELLGAIAISLVLLGGAVLAYWLCGTKVGTVEKLIATDYEMRKVNWSTPREILGSTWVVIGACGFIALTLYAFDLGFRAFFAWTRVL